MKNGKILIIATIILLIGIVLVVGAFALNDFRFDGLDSESFEEKNYTFAEKSDKLIIEDDNSEISIRLSDNNTYNVSCYDGEHYNYEVSQENGTLLIKKNDTRKWWEHIFSFSFGSADLVVEVPADFSGTVEIDSNNGGISLDGIKADDIKINTNNGKITFNDMTSENGIDIDTDNGNIYFTDTSCNGKMKIDTDNAIITLTGVSAGDLEIEKSNGSLNLRNVSVKSENKELGNIKIEGNNDSVDFDSLYFSGSLTIKTDNGHVKGSIIGKQYEYSFRCDTSNGSCNLPEKFDGPEGSHMISIKTDNGSINVEFTEK